jgi:hypothetical protein
MNSPPQAEPTPFTPITPQANATVVDGDLVTRIEQNGDVTYYKNNELIAVLRKEEVPSGEQQQAEVMEIALEQAQACYEPTDKLLVVPGEEAPFMNVKVEPFLDDRKYFWWFLIIGFYAPLLVCTTHFSL